MLVNLGWRNKNLSQITVVNFSISSLSLTPKCQLFKRVTLIENYLPIITNLNLFVNNSFTLVTEVSLGLFKLVALVKTVVYLCSVQDQCQIPKSGRTPILE